MTAPPTPMPTTGERAPGFVVVAVGVFLVLAGTIAGCASSDGSDAAPVTDLASAIGLPADGRSPTDAQGRHLAFETAVAACMRRHGFHYAPATPSPATTGATTSAEPTSERAARRVGFGVSLGLTAAPTDTTETTDPNDAALAAMSESEQAAYHAALGDDATAGCRGQAARSVERRVAPVADDLAALAKAFGQAVERSPVLARLDRRWASCMARAGFAFTDEDAVRTRLEQRLAAAQVPGDGAAGPRYRPAALRALQAYERAVAVAATRCRAPLREDRGTELARIADRLRRTQATRIAAVKDRLGA